LFVVGCSVVVRCCCFFVVVVVVTCCCCDAIGWLMLMLLFVDLRLLPLLMPVDLR
jgi:hypothetical protein